jgi:hypothetical protein
MPPFQQVFANDPEPGANLPFLARGHSLDLLGDVVPVYLIGCAAAECARLPFGPGGNVSVVKSVKFLVSHHDKIAYGGSLGNLRNGAA